MIHTKSLNDIFGITITGIFLLYILQLVKFIRLWLLDDLEWKFCDNNYRNLPSLYFRILQRVKLIRLWFVGNLWMSFLQESAFASYPSRTSVNHRTPEVVLNHPLDLKNCPVTPPNRNCFDEDKGKKMVSFETDETASFLLCRPTSSRLRREMARAWNWVFYIQKRCHS